MNYKKQELFNNYAMEMLQIGTYMYIGSRFDARVYKQYVYIDITTFEIRKIKVPQMQ